MASLHPRRLVGVAAALGLWALAACNDATSTTRPTLHLELVQGVPPVGLPGVRLLDTLRVRVVDAAGRPRGGQEVNWHVLQGGGSVEVLTARSDGNGVASARWTLGAVSGTNQLVARTLEDSSLLFQTEAEAFRVDRLDSDYELGCGLRQGDLWCWGQAAQVTNPPVSESPSWIPLTTYEAPGMVSAGYGFVDLAVAGDAVCALDAAGVVRCYGVGVPTETPGVPPLHYLAGGPFGDFCGLARADSTAWCWRSNSATAGQVPQSPAFLDLALGNGHFFCGRVADSTAMCWGPGPGAPLGDSTVTSSPTPIPVNGGLRFAQLTAGYFHVCGRQASGQVWCWGENGSGQFGVPGPSSRVPVPGPAGVTRLWSAMSSAFAIQNGVLVRWGEYPQGQPQHPAPLTNLVDLPLVDFASSDISCARLVDGQVWCFEELWLLASTLDIYRYVPVQPVVFGP